MCVIMEIQGLVKGQYCVILVPQWSTLRFTGPVQELSELFEEVFSRLKPSGNKSGAATAISSPPSPSLPVISAICLRLLLLRPDHAQLMRCERGLQAMAAAEQKLVYCEAVRKLTLSKWPHRNYTYATIVTSLEGGGATQDLCHVVERNLMWLHCVFVSVTIQQWLQRSLFALSCLFSRKILNFC